MAFKMGNKDVVSFAKGNSTVSKIYRGATEFALSSESSGGTGDYLYTIKNPNTYGTAEYDYYYGNAVYGNYLAVSAYGEDSATGSGYGKYIDIYYLDTGVFIRRISDPSPTPTNYFGYALAIKGNYLLTGNIYYNNIGGAYLFNFMTGELVRIYTNPMTGGTYSDYFGMSFDISDDGAYSYIGAWGEDTKATNGGRVYIYNNSTGSLVGTIDPSYTLNTEASFGYSISVSGSTLVIGAQNYRTCNDNAACYKVGAVSIITLNTSTGLPITTVNTYPPALKMNGYFGRHVETYNGMTIVQRAYIDSTYPETVYIYSGTSYVGSIVNPNISTVSSIDYYGFTATITDNYIAIGAKYEDVNETNDGVVYIYNKSTLSLVNTIYNPSTVFSSQASEYFGVSLSSSGDILVVGISEHTADGLVGSGAVYIYDLATL